MFDIITLWDVLEHIREPVQYLANLQSRLRPGGVVFVQIPSSDSLASRIMRGSCNMYDGIEHLTLFSQKSLDLAFKKAGYELLGRHTVISEMYALNNYLQYQVDPYAGAESLRELENLFTPESIESAGMGYKIQALYRSSQ